LRHEYEENKYETYIKLLDVIKFDKENKLIELNINNNLIKINCNKLEWKNIIDKFPNIMQEKLQISKKEMFNMIICKLKQMEQFKNPENDFWLEYSKLNDVFFPKDILTEYKEYFDKNNWYKLLGFKFINLELFVKFCNKNKINNLTTYHQILKNKNETKYPYYPHEYYRLDGWNNWNNTINKYELI
jgi:hypothetical protein